MAFPFTTLFKAVSGPLRIWKTPPQAAERPEAMPTAEKQRPLSDRVKGWEEEVDLWVEDFLETMADEDIRGPQGVFEGAMSVDGSKPFKSLMEQRVKNSAGTLKERIRQLDQLDRDSHDVAFDEKVRSIFDETTKNMEALKSELLDTARAIGQQEGDRNRIDTYKELWTFEQNISAFKDTADRPAVMTQVLATRDAIAEGTDNAAEKAEPLVTKLLDGDELTPQDYDALLEDLSQVWGNRIDLSREDKARQSLKVVEISGKLVPLHVMDLAQRFELGSRIVDHFESGELDFDQAHRGLLFLSEHGFLDIEQTNVLLRDMSDQLTPEEIKNIQVTRRAIEYAREQFATYLRRGEGGNWVEKHVTGSNVLIYEIFGRIALLGATLPLVLNFSNPSAWENIIMDPIWMSCAGLGAASLDHVTGGIGEGVVTKNLLKLGNATEELSDIEKEAVYEEKALKKLDLLCGYHPEAVTFLTENNGILLTKIEAIALEHDEDESARYNFSFNDLVEYDLEQEMTEQEDADIENPEEYKDLRREQLQQFYRQEMDGENQIQTEVAINDIYQTLSYDLRSVDVSDMLDLIETGRERRGLT